MRIRRVSNETITNSCQCNLRQAARKQDGLILTKLTQSS